MVDRDFDRAPFKAFLFLCWIVDFLNKSDEKEDFE